MGERTAYEPGTFSYVELQTTDPEAAKAFYGGLFGWEPEDVDVGDMIYTMLRLDGKTAGALYEQREEQRSAGVPPNWLSYVTVEDADATAARATELGGNVLAGPFDVLEAGRMAVLSDPQGAVFAVWQPRGSIGAEVMNNPGALTMNQLNTTDVEAAIAFYEGLFGWTAELIPSAGPDDFWSVLNGGRLNGGMNALPADGGAPPHWLAYFRITDLDAAATRIEGEGGQVVLAPLEIPAGRILVAQDPQGAVLGLFEGDVDPDP
jgi:uncharacterized protein